MTTTTTTPGAEAPEPHYCARCKAEGKDTLLFYSEPSKHTDTWRKKMAKKSDYRCKEHVKQDSFIYRRSKTNTEFRNKKQWIEQYHQQKITEFERIWNDPRVRNKPEPERLMEALRYFEIRGQQGYADDLTHDGFTAEEMTEIIRASQIVFSASKYVEEWDKANKDRLTRFIREEIKPELLRVLLEFEADIKTNNRKRQIHSVQSLIQAANVLYQTKGIYEKIVTDPQHRDPAGNKSPRFHLLTLEETLRRRTEKKRRQIASTEVTIQRETLVQEHVMEEFGKSDQSEFN